jgi:hypothetical protein
MLKIAAVEPQIGWVLLGAHRAVFGNNFTGGVVQTVLENARQLPLNVGVVIHSGDSAFDNVCAVADRTMHGRAALDFAARVARQKNYALCAFMVAAGSGSPASAPLDANASSRSELVQLLADAAGTVGQRLHSEFLPTLDSARIAQQSKDGLVIIAYSLADDLEYARDGLGDGRALVLVQGMELSLRDASLRAASERAPKSAIAPA